MADIEQQNTEKFSTRLKDQSLKILKSEGFKVSILVFFSIILLVFTLPFFFNNDVLKTQIARKVSQISGANFIIKGDVRVALVPSPTITIDDVLLQNYKPKTEEGDDGKTYNVYAKSVEIKFPIFKFSDDVVAKKIIITDALLESYDSLKEPMTRANKVTAMVAEFAKIPVVTEVKANSGISEKLFSIPDIDSSAVKASSAPDIIVENGEAIFYDRLARKKEVKAVNFELKIGSKKIFAAGNFNSEDIISNFKFLIKFNSQASKPDSTLEVISPVMSLHINGNFTSENRGILGSDFSGKIDAEILELKSFYKSYISSNGVIAGKLKYSGKPLKISADIANKSQEITVDNLAINSSLVSGTGDMDLSFSGESPLIDISLSLDNLDLDSILSNDPVALGADEKTSNDLQDIANDEAESVPQNAAVVTPPAEQNQTTTIIAQEPKKIEPIDFKLTQKIRNFDLSADIKIKSAKYLEGDISDISLYLTVSKEGEILVLPMIFKIPGEGTFRVNGVLDNTTIVPKFVGKFDANGKSLKDVFKWLKIESQNLKFDSLKDYSLYSDVLLLPNSIALSNFYLNLNNGNSEFLGELKIDNGGNVANIVSRFQVSEFNIDDYFLISGQNIYFSPGSLLKKLLWLNDITSNNDLNLSFDKMIYKKEEFPAQSLKVKFGRGYLEISDLNLQSEKTSLKANLAMDISDKNPRFEISVDADNFHYETADKSPQNDASDKDQSVFKKTKNPNFFDQFFALPSLEGFGGKVSLNFNNLNIDGTTIKNVKLSGKLRDGNIEGSEMALDLYGGSLAYKGLIGVKLNKTINGNLTFNNAALQPLLSNMVGIKNVSGVVNISANVTSVAGSRDEFSKQLSSEIKFNANAPSVDGYGLNDLVKKMFMPQSYRADLQNPENILFNPQAKTIFKQANGTIQINNGKEGRMRVNVTAPAVNAILSGTISAENSSADVLFNVIFLTGNRQKQTPINIATNLKGPWNAISQNTNLDQAKQYLGLAKSSKPIVADSTATFDEVINQPGNQQTTQQPAAQTSPAPQDQTVNQKTQIIQPSQPSQPASQVPQAPAAQASPTPVTQPTPAQ